MNPLVFRHHVKLRHRPGDLRSASQQKIPVSIQETIEAQATHHFLSKFVLLPRYKDVEGFLEFTVDLIPCGLQMPLFKHAFDACAFASIACKLGGGHGLRLRALQSYTKALKLISEALQDQRKVHCHELLAGCFFLSLFETISAQRMKAWQVHIQGLKKLLLSSDMRGCPEKYRNSLRAAVQMQTIMHSLSTGTWPSSVTHQNTTDKSPSLQCQQLIMQAAKLGGEINQLLDDPETILNNADSLKSMIKQCRSLDQDLLAWSTCLPEGFGWKTVYWAEDESTNNNASGEVFPGPVDIYQDLWTCHIWNMMRCTRLVLASKIIRCTALMHAPADYRTSREYGAIVSNCTRLIKDVIASVPYQLGWFSQHRHLLRRPSLSGFVCGQDDTHSSIAGVFLLYPLACVKTFDFASESQRNWVKGRLEHIASNFGIQYASKLAEMDIRMPSMLVARDRLMAQYSGAISRCDSMPSEPKMCQDFTELQIKEMLRKVVPPAYDDELAVRTWLQLYPGDTFLEK
ncbi:hypothetical protein QQS21_003170 [Conoideocrella luteorostrata]|uniref:Uncharacterized protein n=1 Tax=Conoideocrella luteorostrata TaxID=1105319 RepID=A0AAJ0CXY9_9HYPO|nr:hypothetical protein QQS21_003170 [Conoideocrella luteorostrata]